MSLELAPIAPVPAAVPVPAAPGEIKRPCGRPPRGKRWDATQGCWLDDEQASRNDASIQEDGAAAGDTPPLGKLALRQRTQSRRASERDVFDAAMGSDESDHHDDTTDDVTYGRKGVPKRRRSGLLQSLKKQQLPQMQVATATPVAPPDTEVVPLDDLKGVPTASVVGRRIRVWYEYEEDDKESPSSSAASTDTASLPPPELSASPPLPPLSSVTPSLPPTVSSEAPLLEAATT
eukprot:4041250-Prymnesium_polylepis.1